MSTICEPITGSPRVHVVSPHGSSPAGFVLGVSGGTLSTYFAGVSGGAGTKATLRLTTGDGSLELKAHVHAVRLVAGGAICDFEPIEFDRSVVPDAFRELFNSRGAQRVSFSDMVPVHVATRVGDFTGIVRDVSVGGVAFVLAQNDLARCVAEEDVAYVAIEHESKLVTARVRIARVDSWQEAICYGAEFEWGGGEQSEAVASIVRSALSRD